MRIGIFTDAYEPYTSGVITSINMLKSALEEMHHEVYIVTANLEKHKFKYDEKRKIIFIPGIKTGIYNSRLTSIYSRKAMKIIKSWHLDIIHSQTEFGIGMFSRIVAKKLKIPVVHTYHTLYEDYVYYVTHNHFNKIGKKIVIKMTKFFCDKKCDELIVPTDKIKDLFLEKYHINKTIHVIPTGIDTTKFKINNNIIKRTKELKKKYHIQNNDFIIGSVGRIAKEKSFDSLMQALKKLTIKDSNIKLMIIGDGPELENLKNLTKSLNLEKNVIFTGLVDYSDIPSFYHLFNIMTSFSKTETQGLTIIEALAASTPVICIKDPSFEAMIKNKYNGYLFTKDSDFIKDVLLIKENKKLEQDLKKNAEESIYCYSKEVFGNKVLAIYDLALKKKKNSKR